MVGHAQLVNVVNQTTDIERFGHTEDPILAHQPFDLGVGVAVAHSQGGDVHASRGENLHEPLTVDIQTLDDDHVRQRIPVQHLADHLRGVELSSVDLAVNLLDVGQDFMSFGLQAKGHGHGRIRVAVEDENALLHGFAPS